MQSARNKIDRFDWFGVNCEHEHIDNKVNFVIYFVESKKIGKYEGRKATLEIIYSTIHHDS